MGNIVGEGFDPKITEQIIKRQTIYGSINRSNDELTYLNTRTGWCKLVSSVDIDDINIDNVRDLGLGGSNLAKAYVLYGGSSFESRSGKDGAFESISREGISNDNSINNLNAYGVGGNEMGLRPMPGIISAEIKTETRGSIKRATVRIKANNKKQFDIVDILYMRLGYSVLLEWGHSSYYENGDNGKYQTDINNSLAEAFLYQGSYTYTDENNNSKTVDVNYETILDIIQTKRLTSCGNYDAMFAKVVNFSWTFTKEGTYDITINLISLGDVIESLKTNVLLGKEWTNNNSAPQQNTGSAVVVFKDSNEIASYFYAQQSILASYPTGSGNHFGVLKVQNPNDINDTIFFRQEYQNSQFQYYIRLGYFLQWVEENLIYDIDNNPSLKVLKIDTDIESNIIHVLRNQTSSDPRVCTWNQVFEYDGVVDPKYYFAAETNDPGYYIDNNNNNRQDQNENLYVKIMNTYFNLDHIITQVNLLSSSDLEGRVSLYDLLNIFCKGWNNSTGNYNDLEPVIDTEKNIIRIVDKVTLPDRDQILKDFGLVTTPAVFNVYRYQLGIGRQYDADGNLLDISSPNELYKYKQSYAGFIKDFNFTTTVSPRLATMMTVGSTKQGYVLGQDATALSRMNNNLTDRFKKIITSTEQTNNSSFQPLSQRYQVSLQAYHNFLKTLGFKENSVVGGAHILDKLPTLDDKAITAFTQTQKQFNEYQQALDSIEVSSASPNIGFLPFDLSLTMDGLSGMKVYQKFTIDSDFLPSNYPETLEFLIKGITHTIQNNVWNTTIDSMAIPKNPFGTKAETTTRTSTTAPTTASTGRLFRGSIESSEPETMAFLSDILKGIGIPNPNSSQLKFMRIWKQVEANQAAWNPLGTTQVMNGGESAYNLNNGIPVKNYTSRQQGLRATILTINNSNPTYGYAKIISSIKAIRTDTDINKAMDAVDKSSWGSHFLHPINYNNYRTLNNFIWKTPIIPR